jgi:ribonuclease HI
MQHVLRGKNKEADRLANEAMDRGMGRGPDKFKDAAMDRLSPGIAKPAAAVNKPKPAPAAPAPNANGLPQEVTGFVKNGVVHLVEGELPEGTFVRILPARR